MRLPKPILTLAHPDSVSGLTIFDDGAKVTWTEGPGVYLTILRPDGEMEYGDEKSPYSRAMEDGIGGAHREMKPWEVLEYTMIRDGWKGEQ